MHHQTSAPRSDGHTEAYHAKGSQRVASSAVVSDGERATYRDFTHVKLYVPGLNNKEHGQKFLYTFVFEDFHAVKLVQLYNQVSTDDYSPKKIFYYNFSIITKW